MENNLPEERRSRQRFPLEMPLRFSSGKARAIVSGDGCVVNMSSTGVAFKTSVSLTQGWSIKASISWPVSLNEDCALRMVVEGRVLRVDGDLAVMSVERYEFRTSRKPQRATVRPNGCADVQLPSAILQ